MEPNNREMTLDPYSLKPDDKRNDTTMKNQIDERSDSTTNQDFDPMNQEPNPKKEKINTRNRKWKIQKLQIRNQASDLDSGTKQKDIQGWRRSLEFIYEARLEHQEDKARNRYLTLSYLLGYLFSPMNSRKLRSMQYCIPRSPMMTPSTPCW